MMMLNNPGWILNNLVIENLKLLFFNSLRRLVELLISRGIDSYIPVWTWSKDVNNFGLVALIVNNLVI